jgi:hypothetical protein
MAGSGCTCPKDGSAYCAQCQAYAQKAGLSLGAQPVAAVVFPMPLASPTEPRDRYRSKTERRYAQTILDIGIASGILRDYWYEPMKGLWLAPETTYTPDFLVQYTDTRQPLELHEVKGGFIYAKDRQKIKLAAAMYPCYRFLLAQWKGQRWWFTHVPAW